MTRTSLRIVAATMAMGMQAMAAQPQDFVSGDWQGEYTCAQGSTGLTLTVALSPRAARSDSHSVTALFRFYPVDANPSVPQGCFEMSGKVASSSRQVQLDAGRWLLHPDGYVTVNLVGRIDPSGTEFDGVVYGPLCSSFALHRLLGPRATGAASCQPNPLTASAP